MSAAEELTLMRTIKLPTITKGTAAADFDVIVASGKIEKANFSQGHEMLRHVGESLIEKASLEEPFPSNSTARLIRSGNCPVLITLQFRVLSSFRDFGQCGTTVAELMTEGPEGNSGYAGNYL